jgi:hypothetical protein
LGGIEWLAKEKIRKRAANGLPPVEDTLQAAIRMKPILNCGGLAGGLLGQGAGAGHETPSADCMVLNGIFPLVMVFLLAKTAKFGRKVRSILQMSRQFNRQVACSGQGKNMLIISII